MNFSHFQVEAHKELFGAGIATMDDDDIMQQLDLQGSRDDYFFMPDITAACPSFADFTSVSWTPPVASPLHSTSTDLSSCSSSSNTASSSSTQSSSPSSACSLLYAPGIATAAAAMQTRQVESPSPAADDLYVFGNMESIFDLPDLDHWNPSPLLHANEVAAAADSSGRGVLQQDAGCGMAAAGPKVPQPAEAGKWPGCGGGVLQKEQGKEAPVKVEDEEARELAQVFQEWMRINNVSLSPGDLRSIRLNRDIIEWASHHLDRSKRGRVHALKLILSWVQHNHLQLSNHLQLRHGLQKSPPTPSHSASLTLPYSPGLTALGNASTGEMAYPGPPPPIGVAMNGHHFPPAPQFASPFSMLPTAGEFLALDQAQCAASRTKEARRRRMAAQRRHHHRRCRRYGRQQQTELAQLPLNLSGGSVNASTHPSTENWTFWTNTAGAQSAPCMHLMTPLRLAPQTNLLQGGGGSSSVEPQTQIEGWREEKKLKFLLQKVLKQSDVGSLGRIVLPKKEAEIHLPGLDERDGICLPMEDIGTSQVWNMRYRFWPNNKSRMYLLENTGEFVRSNGLQEGDFIVIYLDVKNSKYMIQGVKAPSSVTPAIGG